MKLYFLRFFILPFVILLLAVTLFCFSSVTYAQYEPPPESTPTPTPTSGPGPTATPVPIFIHGYVFNDVDESSFYWSPDTPYWSWEVRLYNSGGGYISSEYTDSSGYYKFSTLPRGTYTVAITPPAGFKPTTPMSYTEYFGSATRRDFGIFFPPPPSVSPNPPSTSCTGNSPRVQIDYTTTANWIQIYWNGDGSLLYNGGPTGQFIHTLPYTWSGVGGIQYSIRGFANSPPGGGDPYSETVTSPMTLPNCYYSISGTVYTDYNRNSILDGVDTAYGGGNATVSLSGVGSQVPGGPGTFLFSNLLAGNYSLSVTAPAGYVVTTTPISYSPLNSSRVNQNLGIVPYYSVSGTVFVDYDNNGSDDAGYPSGATVNFSGTESYTSIPINASTTSNGAGAYVFNNIYAGSYTAALSMGSFPANRYQGIVTSRNITLPPSAANQNFRVIPLYQISGNIFNDGNKNGTYNSPAESPMGGSFNIQITGPSTNTTISTNNGTFTFSQLPEGTYTISLLTSAPPEYRMTNPLNGPPPSKTVTIGRTCIVAGASGASCVSAGLFFTAYDVSNVNFGMTNYTPWFQVVCNDGRINNGIINEGTNNTGFTDVIPDNPGATCGTPYASITNNACTTPGIIYSDTSVDLGVRDEDAASIPEWVVENEPLDSDQFRTSYDYITATLRQSGVAPLDLNQANRCGAGGINNCTLSASLTSGVYLANGNLNLNAYTFPQFKNYIILVNGDLSINGEIHVPVGSSAIFSVAGDIIIAQTIGENNVCSTDTNVEGLYSTDGTFTIDGINNCATGPDLRFNLGGAIITNAAGTTAGSTVENRRDLCANDRNAPAFSIFTRPDLILYVPEFLKYKSDAWREVAP